MKTKKYFAIYMMLVLTLAFGFLTAPVLTAEEGETEETELYNEDGSVNDPLQVEVDENKLVLWSLFTGGDGGFMAEIVDAYNATGPAKEVFPVILVWADYYTKLTTAVAADSGPDIGISHVSSLPVLYDQMVIGPIEEYATAAEFDLSQYTDAMIEAVSFDDQMYAMPLDTHAEILFMNLDLLNEAGVELVDNQLEINSWDDFKAALDLAKENLSEDYSPISLPQVGDDPYRVWWATYYQKGGTPLLSDDGSELTLDRDLAIESAEFVKSLYTEGYVKQGIEDHQQYFQGGNAPFFIGGTWAVGVFEAAENLNFVARTFPQLFDNQSHWADAHTLTLPVNAQRTEEDSANAFDFIAFASTEGAAIWAKSGQIPSNLSVLESEEFTSLPYRVDYAQAGELAVLPTSTPYFNAMKSVMITNLDTFFTDQADAETAIDTMMMDLEAEIW